MPNHLDLSHTLAINGAYILVPRADLNVGGVAVPYHWLNEFERTLACNFSHHLGGYAQTDALRESLRIVYIYYHGLNGHPINANEQSAIKDKIVEGVATCTPGFHNRVNQIVTGFQLPDSIDALMMAYRTDIVSRAASAHTDDVHGHNQYAMIANQMGKNVFVLNRQDPYNFLSALDVEDRLNQAFRRHYHPLAIIDNVVAGYQSILMGHHGYTGKKDAGYDRGDYEAWQTYLATLLQLEPADINLADFLIADEESYQIVDINWPYVMEHFATKLLEKGCFVLTGPQTGFIEQITQVENNFAQFDINAALSLIPDHQTFIQTLERLASKQAQMVAPFYTRYCAQHELTDIEKSAMLRHLLQLPVDLGPLINALVAVNAEFFEEEMLRVENGSSGLMRALLNNQRELLNAYMGLLPNLSPAEMRTLFVTAGATNNPLMQAALSAPWAVETLILNLSCSPNLLQTVLQQVNERRENALMVAAGSDNVDALTSIILAFFEFGDDALLGALSCCATSDGANALGRAASTNVEIFNLIFNYWSNLAGADMTAALSSVDRHGNNLLMRAIRANNQAVVARLFDLAPFYLDGSVMAMLRQNNAANENFFMYALRMQQHDVAPQLMMALQAMDLNTLSAFLLETDASGRNLLMLSIQFAPQFFDELVRLYDRLDEASQRQAYQGSHYVRHQNLLMLALSLHLEAAPKIIDKLAAHGQLASALRHQDARRQNALMLAVEQGPRALGLVLEAIGNNKLLLVELLSKLDDNGFSALNLAVSNPDPAKTRLLLQALDGVDIASRSALFNKVHRLNTRNEALIQAAQLLDTLEEKAQNFDINHPEAAREAQRLHQNLKRSFDTYLNGDASDAAGLQFARAWKDDIAAAKHTALVSHRGYKEIAAIMLLCVSVVGLLVIGIKAAAHYAKEGNMRFFHVTKTHTESCLDEMEHQIKTVAPAA